MENEDRRRLAELSAEVEALKLKYAMCMEAVAKLREELESLKRKARRPALRAYKEVETGGQEPP